MAVKGKHEESWCQRILYLDCQFQHLGNYIALLFWGSKSYNLSAKKQNVCVNMYIYIKEPSRNYRTDILP